jgi:hypothetical protein
VFDLDFVLDLDGDLDRVGGIKILLGQAKRAILKMLYDFVVAYFVLPPSSRI